MTNCKKCGGSEFYPNGKCKLCRRAEVKAYQIRKQNGIKRCNTCKQDRLATDYPQVYGKILLICSECYGGDHAIHIDPADYVDQLSIRPWS